MQNNYLTLCVFLLSFSSLQASAITYYSKTYTAIAGHLMKDDGHNAIFRIPLHNVFDYLPADQDIKRMSIKLIANRWVPGKSFLSILRYFMAEHENALATSSKELFASLQEGKTHTYVVLDNGLIFTESTDDPAHENFKNIFTKHFLLAKLGKTVHFSGEFHVYRNYQTSEIFVVFDNSSGTYKPESILLPQLKSMLENAFYNDIYGCESIFIVTKKYNQKIDKDKLFAHDKEPFIEHSLE